MNCKFTVWKNQTKGMFSNVTITLPMAKKLLAGKSVRMKKLLKNDGTTFDADVELKVDKESQYPVQFVLRRRNRSENVRSVTVTLWKV